MRFAVKAALLAVPFALGLAPTAGAATRVVKVKDIVFTPSKIGVRRGTTVAWRFLDITQHNVQSRGRRRFGGSKDMRRGTHRVRFRKAGRYRYACSIHPLTMKGLVVVR